MRQYDGMVQKATYPTHSGFSGPLSCLRGATGGGPQYSSLGKRKSVDPVGDGGGGGAAAGGGGPTMTMRSESAHKMHISNINRANVSRR